MRAWIPGPARSAGRRASSLRIRASILQSVIERLAWFIAVIGFCVAPPVPAKEGGRVTLVSALQMEELVQSQRRITRLLGQVRAELALAPRSLTRKPGWDTVFTGIETAFSRSRVLAETFSAVAVAEGLSLPLAVFCQRVAGKPLSHEGYAAVAGARHQLEVMTQAMAASGLEEAHGALAKLASAGKGMGEESRQSLMLAEQWLNEAVSLYSHEVLAPFATAVSEVPARMTDSEFPDRVCAVEEAPSQASTSSPMPGDEAEALADVDLPSEGVFRLMQTASEEIEAVLSPPAGLADVPRYVTGNVIPPRKIREVKPTYSARASRACIGGLVVLEAVITTEGRVENIVVLEPLPGLTDSAVRALRKWKFEPAKVQGKPVKVLYVVMINFRPSARTCVRVVSPSTNPWQ